MKSVYVDRNVAAARERKYEVLDSQSKTEQAGYIPPQIQIENMILAGERLNQTRMDMYDFSSADEIDEDAYDPTRRANFDLADASKWLCRLKCLCGIRLLMLIRLVKPPRLHRMHQERLKRVRRCLMYLRRRKGRKAPFQRYIRPLDVYIAQ